MRILPGWGRQGSRPPVLSGTRSRLGKSQQTAEAGLCPAFSSARGPFHSYQNLPGYFLPTGPRCTASTGASGEETGGEALGCAFSISSVMSPSRGKYCALQLIRWNRLPLCTIPGRELIKPLDTSPPWQHLFV